MPFSFDTFMTKVRGGAGTFGKFTLEKSALEDLIKLVDPKQNPKTSYTSVAKAIEHIPDDKKKKYKDALAYLQANLGSREAVSEAHAPRVVAIGDDLEFLQSPLEGTDECLIFGHAGHVPDSDTYGGTFTVPPGVRLVFCTLHGQANTTSPAEVLATKPDTDTATFNVKAFKLGFTHARAPKGSPEGIRYVTEQTPHGPVVRKTEVTVDAKELVRRVYTPQMEDHDIRDAKGRLIRTQKDGQLELKPTGIKGAGNLVRPPGAHLQPGRTRHDKLANLLLGPLDRRHFASGADCYNYVVKNGLGAHWTWRADGSRWTAENILKEQDKLFGARAKIVGDAAQAASLADAWVPHYVYVKSERVVRLSDLLTQLMAFAAKNRASIAPINVYYFGGCRGIHPGWNPSAEE